MDMLQSLAAKTEDAFRWLCRDVPADEPVTFVANPGNVGDALINLSCHRFLAGRFRSVTVIAVDDVPRTDCVFVAGGGNLVEGLYSAIADFVTDRCAGRRLFFFPSSVSGYDGWLDGLAGRARMVSREPISYAHVSRHLADVLLGHDAAFYAAGPLRTAYADAIARHPQTAARFFREDVERAHRVSGDGDIMARRGGDWVDLSAAETAVAEAARTILQFDRIYTDRLHCAILSAMLDRYVVIVPNAYFKNEAVFGHSLQALANVRFELDAARLFAAARP